jgi:hypothetical protein
MVEMHNIANENENFPLSPFYAHCYVGSRKCIWDEAITAAANE